MSLGGLGDNLELLSSPLDSVETGVAMIEKRLQDQIEMDLLAEED